MKLSEHCSAWEPRHLPPSLHLTSSLLPLPEDPWRGGTLPTPSIAWTPCWVLSSTVTTQRARMVRLTSSNHRRSPRAGGGRTFRKRSPGRMMMTLSPWLQSQGLTWCCPSYHQSSPAWRVKGTLWSSRQNIWEVWAPGLGLLGRSWTDSVMTGPAPGPAPAMESQALTVPAPAFPPQVWARLCPLPPTIFLSSERRELLQLLQPPLLLHHHQLHQVLHLLRLLLPTQLWNLHRVLHHQWTLRVRTTILRSILLFLNKLFSPGVFFPNDCSETLELRATEQPIL